MPILLLAASASVPTPGVPLVLTTATVPGHYLLDVDCVSILAADSASVQILCTNATLLSGSLVQQVSITNAFPRANGNTHLSLPVHVVSQTSPGAQFIISHSTTTGNARCFPWAVWQTDA